MSKITIARGEPGVILMKDMQDRQFGVIPEGEVYAGTVVVAARTMRDNFFTVTGIQPNGEICVWSDAWNNTLQVRPLPPGTRVTIEV